MRKFGFMLAAVAFAASFASVASAEASEMRVCTATKGGNYDYVGQQIQAQLRGSVDVTVINTAGSEENLAKLKAGECDAVITQSDSLYLFIKEKGALPHYMVSEMYTEYFHLLCNRKSGIEEFADLADKTVKVYGGGKGSGSENTIRGLKQADAEFGGDDYKDLAILNADPKASLVKVKSRSADCVAYTGSKGNELMTVHADKLADDLVLVPVVDKDFNDVEMTDANGNTVSVWTPVEMPGSIYANIMPSGFISNKDIDTIGVNALLIVSQSYADANDDAFTELGLSINDVVNAVRADKGVELITE